MATIPEHYHDILQSTALAHIATIGPKGEPQVSAVWFQWDGTHILLALNKNRQKYRNLQREARIALSITDPTNPYRGLEIRGTVVQIADDADYHFIDAMSRKYINRDASAEERGDAKDRAVLTIQPERVFLFPPQKDPAGA